MTSDLSSDEILILQTMWNLKALAGRGVTLEKVASQLSDVSKTETGEGLKRLEGRGLVAMTRPAGQDIFALSPLGAACARQLLDGQLGKLTRAL